MKGSNLFDTRIVATGAVDYAECRRQTYWGNCSCFPKCARCGHAKHTAIHGPAMGEPPGSAPWGHEFTPEVAQMSTSAKTANAKTQ